MKISVAGKEIVLFNYGVDGFGGDLSNLARLPSDPLHEAGENDLQSWWCDRQHPWESIGELIGRISPIDPIAAVKIAAWAAKCAEKAGVKI